MKNIAVFPCFLLILKNESFKYRFCRIILYDLFFLTIIIIDNMGKICYNKDTKTKEKLMGITVIVTKKIRHSSGRDKIYTYLCSTKEHPSANMIYKDMKPVIPKLSLGTVYTNLKLFEEQGKVIRVVNVNGVERYDADTSEHIHFVCDKCGAVIDVMDTNIKAIKRACHTGKAKIKSIKIVLHGICEGCSEHS